MPRVQHLLETRFSVRWRGSTLPARDWLDERLRLFREFTLPSVAAQTTSTHTWLLFCDESTDSEVLEILRAEQKRLPTLQVALTSPDRTPLQVTRSLTRPDAEVLVTTRLDSDDAIADGYLEAVQTYADPFHRSRHDTLVVNFPRGYRLDTRGGSRLYRDWMASSPFHSLFERPQQTKPKTVLNASGHANLTDRYADYRRLPMLHESNWYHARLHQHYPTHQDESLAAWMIVVHGGNVANQIPPNVRELGPGAQPAGFTLNRFPTLPTNQAMGR